MGGERRRAGPMLINFEGRWGRGKGRANGRWNQRGRESFK